MSKRIFWPVAVLTLIASLMAVPVVTGAQESLTVTYTWTAYQVSIQHPAGWVVDETDTRVSVHPADRDVSDGAGPEVVLFVQLGTDASQLDTVSGAFAGAVNGTTGPVTAGEIAGHATRSFTFDQTEPDTVGVLTIIALDENTLAGMAYTVRNSEADQYLPTLEAMAGTLTLAAASPEVAAYSDPVYGYTLAYPDTWTLTPGDDPGAITVSPAGVDLSANNGPQAVVLILSDMADRDLDVMMEDLITSQSSVFDPVQSGMLDGAETRWVTYTNDSNVPVLSGGLMLVRLGSDILAFGYWSPATEFAEYELAFEAIRASLHLESPSLPGASRSESVASVQLPQRYTWDSAGLALYFPAEWEVDWETFEGEESIFAQPPLNAPVDSATRLIQISRLDWFPTLDLHDLATATTADEEGDVTISEITIAGYEAVTYDALDRSEDLPYHFRTVLVNVADHESLLVMFLSTTEDDWENFRPLVSAFLGSIEAINGGPLSWLPETDPASEGTIHPVAAIAPTGESLFRQDGDTKTHVWEELGITFTIPADWEVLSGGQDYDLALVSAQAMQGEPGAFLTLSDIPNLGDTTPDEALAPLAEDLGATVDPFMIGNVEGISVVAETADSSGMQYLVLVPYSDTGEVIYIQGLALPEEQETLEGILSAMQIAPIKADHDAIDAAWQTSLAESGRLVYGDPDAPVALVEFLSFTCGHCANYSAAVDRFVALEVEDAGRVQFEWAALAGDEYSMRATHATYCATEQGKGYSAYKTLFQGYFTLGYDTAYTGDGVNVLLAPLGLDMDALNQCIEDETYSDQIAAIRTRFTDGGMTGTPTLAFGVGGDDPEALVTPDGETWSGAIPIPVVRAILTQVIDEGVPLSEVLNQ